MLVVQRRLTHYRVPFFERLRADMAAAGLELVLAHGDPTPEEVTKRDGGQLPWAHHLTTRYALGGRLCWQPFGALAAGAELTVITAENKLVYNLVEQFDAASRRVALWGHGANLQGDATSLRERFKARLALRADWWLAYTEMSRGLVEGLGFPKDRITVLDNAVDMTELCEQFAAVTPAASAAARREMGLDGGPVALYLGSLYAEKRVDFLLESARQLRQRLPGFNLVVIGGGPELAVIQAAAQQEPWIKALGVRKGMEKVVAASVADVMLNPGLVGLNILDSFAGGLPMLTTDCGLHSPEIAYLESGRNGLMTANTLDAFVEASLSLLTQPERRAAMAAQARADALRYTLAHMSERFTEGVLGALAAPIRRGRT
ncbi:glycosyltransferase family 4 protein [Roseateles sp. DJS-2-20]|uniref:Glycosyltransferase family 4 protein n=1 Tax=Roseateles paludis TaxID=3145238 RepID=A0ABV0G6N0_9BURK